MAWLAAEFASSTGTVAGAVAFNATQVASAGEWAFDLGIGAIDLVVTVVGLATTAQYQWNGAHSPDFAAVEALSRQATALRLIRTIASEVTDLIAATVY